MIADDLSRIAMASNLAGSLSRATDYARAQGHAEVTLEHMLLALCDDPDAVLVMAASNVNVAELMKEVGAQLSALPTRGVHGQAIELVVAPDLRRILEAAAAAARGGRRREINGAIVLAAIIGDGKSPSAHVLRNLGLTFEGAIRALQRAQPPVPKPPAADAEAILAGARERVQSRTGPPMRRLPANGGYLHGEAAAEAAPALPAPASEEDMAPPLAARAEPVAQPAPEPASESDVELENTVVFEPEPSFEPATGMEHEPVLEPAPASEPEPRFGAELQFEPEPHFKSPPAFHPELSIQQDAHADEHAPPPMPASAPFPPPIPVPDALDSWTPPPMPPAGPTPPPFRAPAPPPPFIPSAPGTALPRPGPPPLAPWPDVAERRRPEGIGAASSDRPSAYDAIGADNRFRLGRKPVVQAPQPASRPAPVARAEIGQLVENIPRSMRVAVATLIEVRVARANVQALAEGLQGGGAAYHHEVTVTKAMSVRLRAPDGGFFIETASPETQWIEKSTLLSSDDFASWRWHVTPREKGRRRLQLIISARTVSADGLAAETALPDQVITVRVKTNYAKVARHWAGWGIAALLGGLLAKFGEGTFDAGLQAVAKLLGG